MVITPVLPLPLNKEEMKKYNAQNIKGKSNTNWAMERGVVLNAIIAYFIGYLCISPEINRELFSHGSH